MRARIYFLIYTLEGWGESIYILKSKAPKAVPDNWGSDRSQLTVPNV